MSTNPSTAVFQNLRAEYARGGNGSRGDDGDTDVRAFVYSPYPLGGSTYGTTLCRFPGVLRFTSSAPRRGFTSNNTSTEASVKSTKWNFSLWLPQWREVRSNTSVQRGKQARVRAYASKTPYQFRQNTEMYLHHHLQVWTGRRPVQSAAEPQPNSSKIRGRVVPRGDSDSVSVHPFPIYQSHFALKHLPSN